ncbi:MAG TPA: phospholipase D-like domain-containing protein [Ktedonobacteraceae bacterium]
MRTRNTSAKGLTLRAVTGTYVVLLGFDIAPQDCKGLLGFAVQRSDQTGDRWLSGGITFPNMTAGPNGAMGTNIFPIQKFRWGDYTAQPGSKYTYKLQAMYGSPGALVVGDSVSVDVQTEDPLRVGNGSHQVHFNRSAAASQAYVHKFGDVDPTQVPGGAAFVWLSRGLEESLIAFIGRATDETCSLHLSVYEFQKDNFLEALRQAVDRKVNVEIIYDAIAGTGKPRDANQAAIQKHQLDAVCHPRTNIPSISHNKFIVLSQNNQPLAVWTGSTNFTDGAIYGQANVGHAIEDRDLAATYLQIHQALLQDPNLTTSRHNAEQFSPVPAAATASLFPIFSPRSTMIAIDTLAQYIHMAQKMVCFTAPFGLDPELNEVFDDPQNTFLTFGLLNTADNKVEATHRTAEDRFVSVARIATKLDQFQVESLHHQGVYIHTKYMLIDPLSSAPLLVTGSANFSKNSSEENDENQLVITQQPAVVDVYLGEFMRMYEHYRFRYTLAQAANTPTAAPVLFADDSWASKYFAAGLEQQDRQIFSS